MCCKNGRGRQQGVNRFIGLSGITLLTSLNKSVVQGRESTIASTSISKVRSDSSFRLLLLWLFNKEVKIVLALLICLSHTLPILLAEGGFRLHSIHSPPLSLMKSLSFVGPFLQKLSQIQKKLQQSCIHDLILGV